MTAYVIVDTKIHDAEGYEEYKALAKPLVEKYGGRYLARGGAMQTYDNDLWTPTRMVLLEFADREQAQAFIDGEEYAPVAALRHRYADSTVVLIDGI